MTLRTAPLHALLALVAVGIVAPVAVAAEGGDARPSSMTMQAAGGLSIALESDGDAHGLRRFVFELPSDAGDVPNLRGDWLPPVQIVGGQGEPVTGADGVQETPMAPMPSPALLAGAGLLTLAGARRRR